MEVERNPLLADSSSPHRAAAQAHPDPRIRELAQVPRLNLRIEAAPSPELGSSMPAPNSPTRASEIPSDGASITDDIADRVEEAIRTALATQLSQLSRQASIQTQAQASRIDHLETLIQEQTAQIERLTEALLTVQAFLPPPVPVAPRPRTEAVNDPMDLDARPSEGLADSRHALRPGHVAFIFTFIFTLV